MTPNDTTDVRRCDELNRRGFVRGVGGAAVVGGLVGSGLLSGCGGGNGAEKNTAASNAKVKLPTYVPYEGVKPDLPGDERKGITAGYLRYPKNPDRATDGAGVKGIEATFMGTMYAALPPAKKDNLFWRELDKRTGASIEFLMVPDSEYADKFATITAGGELPDVSLLSDEAPQRPRLLAAKFQDLSDFLSGNAIKKYPFLANLPTESWRATVYNGGIYGLPMPRPLTGSGLYCRVDVCKQKGLDPQPKSFADFRTLCKALTDPKANTWAIGGPTEFFTLMQEMLGVPNEWAVEKGKFTAAVETEQSKQALDALRKLVKDGVFHPDAFSSETVRRKEWFTSGRLMLNYDGYTAWPWLATTARQSNPTFEMDAIVAPGFDGGKGTHRAGGPSYSISVFKKAEKKRIEQLLEIANFLAAPFGTEEYRFIKYGVPGAHHRSDGSDPVKTDRGEREITLPIGYVTDAPYAVYWPGEERLVRAWWDFQNRAMPITTLDPTVGLYSDTRGSKGGQLDEHVEDVVGGILQGRKPLSDWDDAIKTWKQDGGDKIRDELEESYAAVHG